MVGQVIAYPSLVLLSLCGMVSQVPILITLIATHSPGLQVHEDCQN
jgi:hypothetical protein